MMLEYVIYIGVFVAGILVGVLLTFYWFTRKAKQQVESLFSMEPEEELEELEKNNEQ